MSHKDTYEMHDKIVKAERALKAAGWTYTAGDMISYDSDKPLTTDWGVRYVKGDKKIFLNRFTAEMITDLLENL